MSAVGIQFDALSHRYTCDGITIPSVTQILKATGLIDYSMIPQEVLLTAAKRGTMVHRALEYLDRDELDESSVDEQIAGYIDAAQSFYRDAGFQVAHVEQRLFDPTWGYAGTLDRTGFIGESHIVLDFKSGLFLPAHYLQLAGYALCLPDPHKYRRISLELHDDGAYVVHERERKHFNGDNNTFLSAVAVIKWRMLNDTDFKIWQQ